MKTFQQTLKGLFGFGSLVSRRVPARLLRACRVLQSGGGTIDALLGLGLVATMAVPAMVHYANNTLSTQIEQGVSAEMIEMALATSQYTNANYGSFALGASRIMTGTLGLENYLPAGFGLASPSSTYSAATDITTQYGTYSLYAYTQTVSTPQGPNHQVSTILVLNQGGSCYRGVSGSATTGTTNGVKTVLIPCKIVPAIASMIGSQGGYAPGTMFPNPSGYTLAGATGTWGVPSGSPLAGVIGTLPAGALAVNTSFSSQTQVSSALERTNIGNPAGNTMFTNIFMDNNSITGASGVQTYSVASPSGTVGFNSNSAQNVTTVSIDNTTTTSVWAPVHGVGYNSWTTVPLYPNYISWSVSNSDTGGSECSSQIAYWTGNYVSGTPEIATVLTGLWAC